MDKFKLMYISQGNIPSREANSIQIAKMSQAFSCLVFNFELITQSYIYDLVFRSYPDITSWYGLRKKLNITRLPLLSRRKRPLLDYVRNRRFPIFASLYARMRSPDVVYTRWAPVVRNSLRLGLRVLWEWHEPLKGEIFANAPFDNNRFLGMVTISKDLASDFVSKNKLSPKKVLVAPDGVDLAEFQSLVSKKRARIQIGFQQDLPLIVYCGNLFDHKGIPTLLKVSQLMHHCVFILVGGLDDDVNRTRCYCEENRIYNTFLTGFLPKHQALLYLSASDILILPNSANHYLASTTSPLKLFEYMASGKPIVASSLSNIQSVLSHGRNGVLVPPDDPKGFAEAIKQLLNNPLIAKNIGLQARKDVQAFDWQCRAERILEFISQSICLD